ncbi:MAG: hypothetical protein WDO24_25020 [Pseudomonadota bacterium]
MKVAMMFPPGRAVSARQGVWRRRKARTRRIDSAMWAGPFQGIWVSMVGARAAISSLGRLGVGLVVAGLQEQWGRAAFHEVARDREHEVVAEHVMAEARHGRLAQARVARAHRLAETAHDLVPGIAIVMQADRILQHRGGDPLGHILAQAQAERGADAAAHDVEASVPQMVHQRQMVGGIAVPTVVGEDGARASCRRCAGPSPPP